MEHFFEKTTVEEISKEIQRYHDERGTYWCPFSRRFITPGVPVIEFIDSFPLLAPPNPPLSDETKQILRQVLQDLRQLSIEYAPQIRTLVHRTRFPEYGGLGEMEAVCPGKAFNPVLPSGIDFGCALQRKASEVERPNMVFKVVKARTSDHSKGTTTYMDGHLRFDYLPEFGDDRPVQG